MEPDQHLLLPPAGGRGDAGSGDRVHDGHRPGGTRRSARTGPEETFPKVFGRISFFVNAGIRFIEEHAKLRAMGQLWEELGRERYGVTDEKFLRFRYGVQVNSLGLTEAQPENNVIRIVLEALAVTLGRDSRARAIQLPAWNEALGLPRAWDQQWSLRIQQILAHETDLLDYPDIFEGSQVMDGLVEELIDGARKEIAIVAERGGAVAAVDYMKTSLVESHRDRVGRIESGEQKVVGQNSYTEAEPSPLQTGEDGGILHSGSGRRGGSAGRRSSPGARARRGIGARSAQPGCRGGRRPRDQHHARDARSRQGTELRPANGQPPCARSSASTGRRRASGGAAASWPATASTRRARRCRGSPRRWGGRIRILVGKPGLDGHSNGAEQIALRARDVGMAA